MTATTQTKPSVGFVLNFPVQFQAWKEFQGQCQITTLYQNCVTCPLTRPLLLTSSGSQRDVNDYQPRAQIKKKFEDGTFALDDPESIGMFSKTFAVEERLTRKYLEHLEYIRLKKEKRSEERKRKKQDEIMKTYDDFDWVQMFHKGTLEKLTVPVLNLYLDRHHLAHGKMKKAEKVNTIKAWLANSEYHKIQQNGIGDGDNEAKDDDGDPAESVDSDVSDDEDDVILFEVGESSNDDGSDSENDEILQPRNSRTGRSCTTYLTRHF